MKEYYRVTREDIEKASKEATWGWCVPTALYLALLIEGVNSEIDDLADEMATTHKYGTSMEELRRALWDKGFWVTDKAGNSWEDLKRVRENHKGAIFIEWWDDRDYEAHGLCSEDTLEMDKAPDSHITLVEEVTDQAITLIDTGFEKRVTLSREWFEERWGKARKDAIPDKGWLLLVQNI